MLARRQFILSSAAALAWQKYSILPTTRPNLARIDHDRILAAAARALTHPTTQSFAADLPALAAANLITPDPRYPAHAALLLEQFLKQAPAAPELQSFQQLLDRSALAEVAQSIPFLKLEASLETRVKQWFAVYLTFLSEDREALLAADAKDHHASSWLLQTTAFARLTTNEKVLSANRRRFRTQTIRAQISPSGQFPHELQNPNALRYSLFNLDLLAGACRLLSTQFDDAFAYELQDGPGMRVAVAAHAAFMRSPNTWPYAADQQHVRLLPGRRPALLFAARAFNDPAYVSLWETLNPDPDPSLLPTFPIRQPILWPAER